jgi:hypothetical protein
VEFSNAAPHGQDSLRGLRTDPGHALQFSRRGSIDVDALKEHLLILIARARERAGEENQNQKDCEKANCW